MEFGEGGREASSFCMLYHGYRFAESASSGSCDQQLNSLRVFGLLLSTQLGCGSPLKNVHLSILAASPA